MLDKLGCRVLLAQDGSEAIALYQEHRATVDLLLIDMRMPGADGSEVVRQIRDGGNQVKMILMGGGEELRDVESHLAAGYTSVLPKPFDINVIRVEISQLLAAGNLSANGAGAA
jgi:two-component system, cell cycle sensor histidine kinase and response regulator CckA